ncbi:hypothetical protein NMY22_g170 [Coprinellus aureogranulatus]|nr:hypothetical protein NMY22_g170 [Coprinellus aureogranulatus]
MQLPHSPATFFRDELDRALKEQSFGIQSYKLTGSTPRQSSASVVTLEGLALAIILTTQGYSVDVKRSDAFQYLRCCSSQGQPQVYETLEGLLQEISPLYARKAQERLIDALRGLA